MNTTRSLVDPFDRSIGNGSSSGEDDTIETGNVYEMNWGSQAATDFNPEEVRGSPKQRAKFRKFEKLNHGKGEQSRDKTIRASHINNDLETFMSVLELPSRQRDTIREVVEEVGVDSNKFGGIPYEKIILTICSLVADEALSNNNGNFNERLLFSDEYRELMNVTGMSSKDHRSLRVKIRDKSSYFG